MCRGVIFGLLVSFVMQLTAQSTGKYQIKFLEVNKRNSDYGVAILDENKVIFASADQPVTSARKNYNPRKDLYVGDIDFDGEIINIKRVNKEADKNFNQTGVAYTKDRKSVYFSRNRYWKKLKKQNQPKNKRMELYKADVDTNGEWVNIKKLPFNKKNSTANFPVLSPDDSQLYFVSDRLPSNGGTDIFVVDILDNGKYSKPRNLGENVNTTGQETTPYITKDNILYFSSDGHEGKGKLDVYAVEVYDEGTSETYHLAEPINSINDDFAYIVNEDNNQGFFTSNRLQGEGFNDLYSFTLEEDVRPGECFITVDGKVRDKETKEVLAGATVNLYSLEGNLLETVSTYTDGTYKFTVSCADEYELVASNPEYKSDKKRIEILEENYHSALHANMDLDKIKKEAPKMLAKLQPIYYEFDDATITAEAAEEMDRIAEIMRSNPDLVIEASSFTDSRGSNNYNERLSNKRAEAAMEYLKSQGIDARRIKSKWYGEERLINQCVNGVECEEEAHKMNRRTEFNFVNSPTTGSRKQSKKKSTRLVLRPKAVETKTANQPISKQGEIAMGVQTEFKQPKAMTKPASMKTGVIEEPVETIASATLQPEIKKVTLKEENEKAPERAVVESTKSQPILESNEEKPVVVEKEPKEVSVAQVEKQEAAVEEKKEPVAKEAVIINYNSSIVATNPESNKVLNYIGSEKEKMIIQLKDLQTKYASAIKDYPKVADSLQKGEKAIAKMVDKASNLEETGWSNIIEYKNTVLHYKKRYRQLMVENRNQSVAGRSTRRERQLAHEPAKQQASSNNGAIIVLNDDSDPPKVDDVQITAMKMNGKGKYQKTTSAKKADLIKVTFKILATDKVQSGQKEAHIVMENPEGKVENAKGIFTIKDTEKESKYTDHAVINYNNHDMDVTMFIQRKGNTYEKGVYPVKVFVEGHLMAVTNLKLDNSY